MAACCIMMAGRGLARHGAVWWRGVALRACMQERFQREAMRCQDQAQEMVPYDASPTDQKRAQVRHRRAVHAHVAGCMTGAANWLLQGCTAFKASVCAALWGGVRCG